MIRAMQLYYQKHPQKRPQSAESSVSAESERVSEPIIIIPGLFGSTKNWRSFASNLSAIGDVYVIDQRNHGESPHADSHSYADMVADLLEFMDGLGFASAHLVGHSMGGKVAMCCALWHPERVSRLCVLDIAPVTYQHSHAPFLSAMLSIDLSQLKSRSEADRLLLEAIPDKATRMFLLQSLSGSPGGYSWNLNLQVLHDFMDEIIDFPVDTMTWSSQSNVATVLISGSLSTYVDSSHQEIFRRYFANADFVSIAEAGHWLHVEQPAAVLAAISSFLLNKS